MQDLRVLSRILCFLGESETKLILKNELFNDQIY